MAVETVRIADLKPLQTRSETNAAVAAEYAERMADGAKFPPVTVFADAEANTLWLADGIHRVEAVKSNGGKTVRAEVTAGTKADALKHALGANANHGLRRTNADKQRALQMAWDNRRQL